MAEIELLATTAFGMEAIVVRELRDLGYTPATVEDGRVRFRGDHAAICRTNLWLRCAERVQVVVADFPARDFDDLFDQVKVLPWEEWLPVDAKFPVTARCVRSEIRSVPNTQKMVKRAIVERLRKIYSRHWFEEIGSEYNIEASIVGNRALLTIDTTGDGLHKRGYRNLVGQAPLRETLAAALVKLSYWNRDRLLVDSFCGSGTIPIEAAMIGRNLAPGRNRSFLSENWPQLTGKVWAAARAEVKDLEDRRPLSIPIVGTDRDRSAIKMATQHARQAGVETEIHFEVKDFVAFPTNRDCGILICNPPYGERLGQQAEVRKLYEDMGELLRPLDDWSLYVLTAAEGFERSFGKRADRRRKLYNARFACTYYQYLGPKPAGIEVIDDEADQPQMHSRKDSEPTPEHVARPSAPPVSQGTSPPPETPWKNQSSSDTSADQAGHRSAPTPAHTEERPSQRPVINPWTNRPYEAEHLIGQTRQEVRETEPAAEQNIDAPSPEPAPESVTEDVSQQESPSSISAKESPGQPEDRDDETFGSAENTSPAPHPWAKRPAVPTQSTKEESDHSAEGESDLEPDSIQTVDTPLPESSQQEVIEEAPEQDTTESMSAADPQVEEKPEEKKPPAAHPWTKNPWPR